MIASNSAKSRMERIIRLLEQIDGIKADIRDIYAEEKSDGGDKTAMGSAITQIRKREKDRTKFDDREVMVDAYLNAFASHTHAYAREPRQIADKQSSAGKVSDAEHPSAGHVSPPARNRKLGSGSVNTGGSDVTDGAILTMQGVSPHEGETSLAAREGEQVAATNFPDPRLSGAADGRRGIPSSDADGAKSEGVGCAFVGQAAQAGSVDIKSEQAVTNSSSALSSSMASETAGTLTSSPDVPADQFEDVPDFVKRSHAHHDDRSAA